MNKFVKGGVAVAAAVILLMGGAGSLAYWSDSQTYNPGSISTGHLKLTASGAGSWSNTAISHWVPGDSNTYTATYTLSVVGDHIGVAFTTTPTGGALPSDFTETNSVVVKKGATTISDTSNLAEGDYTVTASTTVTFNSAATGSQDLSAQSLGSIALVATQVHP